MKEQLKIVIQEILCTIFFGPRTDPCGTPYFTGDNWDDSQFK